MCRAMRSLRSHGDNLSFQNASMAGRLWQLCWWPFHNQPACVGLFRLTPRALAPKALPGHTGMISKSSHFDMLLEGITSAGEHL